VIDEKAPTGIKILVTGASGFLGSQLIDKLVVEGEFLITALVRDADKAHHLRSRGIRTIVADLSDRHAVDRAVKGHHTIINLAHDFKRSQRNNLRCFVNLSEACIKHGVQHFVHTSSIVVYDDWPVGNISEESAFGQPGTEYKNTKVAIENALQRSAEKGLLHSSILQPTIIYGPFSWLWTDHIVEQLLSGTVILPAGEEGICNAVHIDDVVDAVVLAVKHPGRPGEKYIISGPVPPTWREFFESYNQFLGADSIRYVEVAVLAAQRSGPAGKMKSIFSNPSRLAHWKSVRSILDTLERLIGDQGIKVLNEMIKSLKKTTGPLIYYPEAGDLELYCAKGVCSTEKAKQLLGYVPKVDFKSGFALTAEYLAAKLNGHLAGLEKKNA